LKYIKFSEVQKEILDVYIKLFKKDRIRPATSQLREMDVTKDRIKRHFGNMSKLFEASKIYDPDFHKTLFDDSKFLSEKYFATIKKKVKKHKKFVVTTAISCCDINKQFLETIENYCKLNNALLLIIPVYDNTNNINQNFDPLLNNKNIVSNELLLNSNVCISDIKISPKFVDPVTSLDRLGNRDHSFIYGSPKQRLTFVPNENDKYPLALMTTGAITNPSYLTTSSKNTKSSYMAKNDHIMGGVIIELIDDKFFHFRQIQLDDSGGFYDLGKYYNKKRVKKNKASAFVLGDYHSGETDKVVDSCWKEVIKEVGVKNLVLHDAYNGLSINHHDQHKIITLAKKANNNKLNLKNEVKQLSDDLNKLSPLVDNIIIAKSNHDEVLARYLQECRFRHDPENFEYALELALEMVRHNDPLKYAVENQGLNNKKKIQWLKRDESFKICGIELGDHGDKGSNGSYGNLKQMERAYGNSVTGHTHVPEILRGAFRVGTSSIFDLDYKSGLSSWMHTSCLVYPNGNRQLINVINGTWKL